MMTVSLRLFKPPSLGDETSLMRRLLVVAGLDVELMELITDGA
jgi:hypothetical protein